MIPVAAIAAAFTRQARICRTFHAPLCGALMDHCAQDVAAGGPTATLVADWALDPVASSLPLRVLAAVHEDALAGAAPALAACYPTLGGVPDAARAWPAFRAVLFAAAPRLRPRLGSPPQTNEVQRSAVLLPGLATAATAFAGLPVRLLELGASAGLNLLGDRFRLELPGLACGPADATVVLRPQWSGPVPAGLPELRVAERHGCDLRPTPLHDADAVRRLESYIWCDRADRLARLRAAVAVGRDAGVTVTAAPADQWLPRWLAAPTPGRVTVVQHSSVWAYLPAAEKDQLRTCLLGAARAATAAAPLCWLRFEDPADGVSDVMELRLTCWPGGAERFLATAQSHGEWVRWH